MKKVLEQYESILNFKNIDNFLLKYLTTPSLVRLKNIGYFCGMDYASKDIYDFNEYVSRYDHSIFVALLTWKFTSDKKATLAALFHDISTPCFSHVIDYMNKDYHKQESTEAYTRDILKNDKKLLEYLIKDDICLEDIIDFKKYSIVDNDRPKLCADRLDGIILTGLFWTKGLKIDMVKDILNDIEVYINEAGENELGFNSENIKDYILKINSEIDLYCHSKEDNYMMELLANITRDAINKNIIKYSDLYVLDEKKLFYIFENSGDNNILNNLKIFKEIKLNEIPLVDLPNVKVRSLKPLVRGMR